VPEASQVENLRYGKQSDRSNGGGRLMENPAEHRETAGFAGGDSRTRLGAARSASHQLQESIA